MMNPDGSLVQVMTADRKPGFLLSNGDFPCSEKQVVDFVRTAERLCRDRMQMPLHICQRGDDDFLLEAIIPEDNLSFRPDFFARFADYLANDSGLNENWERGNVEYLGGSLSMAIYKMLGACDLLTDDRWFGNC